MRSGTQVLRGARSAGDRNHAPPVCVFFGRQIEQEEKTIKIDFDGLQAFVAIAELGGFGKAASSLHVTQTALTRRLQKLEAYLGMRLLDRTTRSVQLTPVGREFLPQAGRMVNDVTFAVERLKDISRLGKGSVTIASIPTMAHHTLPSVIRSYAQRHSGNRIRILESSATEVTRTVLQGQAEFGITLRLERFADLVEEPCLEEPFMFFCRAEHPLSRNKSVSWKDLRETELIMVSGHSGNRALLDYQLARKRVSLNSMYEVQHLSTAIALVSAGVGTAILPSSTIQEGTYPMVRRVPLIAPIIKRTVILIRKKNTSLSPATKVFYDMLAEHLQSVGKTSLKRKTGQERAPSSVR
jgi:DNA-binding transcriptional LysR family regulator